MARMLDLDHVGAERRQDLRAVRAGQRARQIEHPDAFEGVKARQAVHATDQACRCAFAVSARLESSPDEPRCESRCGRAVGPRDARSTAPRAGTQFARVLARPPEGVAVLPSQGTEGSGRDDPPVAGTCLRPPSGRISERACSVDSAGRSPLSRSLAPSGRKWVLLAFVWSILPRRLALVAIAVLGAFFLTIVGFGLGLTILVLHAA